MRYRLTTAATTEARVLLALASARMLWDDGLQIETLAKVAGVTEDEARAALATWIAAGAVEEHEP